MLERENVFQWGGVACETCRENHLPRRGQVSSKRAKSTELHHVIFRKIKKQVRHQDQITLCRSIKSVESLLRAAPKRC